MARRLSWTESAWDDLEGIADHIARDSSYYAATLVASIRRSARSLGTFCERGRIVPEFEDPSVREIFVRRYRLIYKLAPQSVIVLGIIHGARDLQTLWEDEQRDR